MVQKMVQSIFYPLPRVKYGLFFLWGGEAKHYFLGMGGMQSLSSQGGMVGRLLLPVEKEVLVRREGWKVDILVTATDLWSVHRIIQIILSGFSTDYLYVKILRWAVAFLLSFVMRMLNWHLNTGL